MGALSMLLICTGIIAGWLCRAPVRKYLVQLQARRRNPESRAARQLLRACQMHRPDVACIAFLSWKRAVIALGKEVLLERLLNDEEVELRQQADLLSRMVFGDHETLSTWSGDRMAEAFRQTCRRLHQLPQPSRRRVDLPTLNPSRRPLSQS